MQAKTKLIGGALLIAATGVGGGIPLILSQTTHADSPVVVNSLTGQGWITDDTRANGHVALVGDSHAPLGQGALSLKTDASPTAGQDKAQFNHYLSTLIPLSSVTGTLGYYTKQNSALFAAGDPAYQVIVYLNSGGAGTNTNFDTLTFEPYIDQGNAAVQNGVWQDWSISQASSKFYSSHSVTGNGGDVTASQGSSTYTLNQIMTYFPNATVLGYGVNVGSNNPGYDTETDAFTFNGTTYDFEPAAPAVPTGLHFENPTIACGGYTNIDFTSPTWNAIDGAASYNYHVDGPNGLTYDTNTTATQLSGTLGSGVQGAYTFKVQAVSADGVKSAFSPSCTLNYDTTAPSAPKLKSPHDGNTVQRHTFNFVWKPVTDPSGVTYEWQSSTNKHFTSVLADHTGLTSTTLSSPNTPNGVYYWRVRATDGAGNTSAWSDTWKVVVNVKTLHAPSLDSPDKNATLKSHNFTFKWDTVDNPNTGKISYQWQSSSSNATNADGSFQTALASHTSTNNTLASPNTPNGVYYWHVRALDADGYPGAWSPIWKVTVNAH